MSNITGPLSYVHDDLVAYDSIAGQREEGGVLLALAVMQALPSLSLRLGGGLAALAALGVGPLDHRLDVEQR